MQELSALPHRSGDGRVVVHEDKGMGDEMSEDGKLMKTADIPHVSVSVTFRGKTVRQDGCHFIDAIHFLCQAEEAVRLILKMCSPVDFAGTKRANENLRRLLEEGRTADD